MHGYDLIVTLTAGLGAALILGYCTHRVGLSPIVGYLLAGTLLGPHTPGFVANASMAEQMAEMGTFCRIWEQLLSNRSGASPSSQ